VIKTKTIKKGLINIGFLLVFSVVIGIINVALRLMFDTNDWFSEINIVMVIGSIITVCCYFLCSYKYMKVSNTMVKNIIFLLVIFALHLIIVTINEYNRTLNIENTSRETLETLDNIVPLISMPFLFPIVHIMYLVNSFGDYNQGTGIGTIPRYIASFIIPVTLFIGMELKRRKMSKQFDSNC